MEIGVLGAINANVLRMHTHINEKLHIGHATNFNYHSFTKAKCVCSTNDIPAKKYRIQVKRNQILWEWKEMTNSKQPNSINIDVEKSISKIKLKKYINRSIT